MSLNPQSSEQAPTRSSKRFWFGITFTALIIVAILLLWPKPPTATNENGAVNQSSTASQNNHAAESATTASAANPNIAQGVGDTALSKEKTSQSRSAQDRTVLSASGVRKQFIDPMASWSELPAWPEGPRLYAEVETESRRYVNLRPDDVGEMPRIRADAEERIELRVTFPDGEPGEKIHVELPNGGSFADSEVKGRILFLSENRTLDFTYITDQVQGYCNVKLRHRGHTRSLPVWVGELPSSPPEP